MRNEAWALVSERVARFEQGRLPLTQLVEDLAALEAALDPPRESWGATFHLALDELTRRVSVWQGRESSGFPPMPEPDYNDSGVRDLMQIIARLVRHPDDA